MKPGGSRVGRSALHALALTVVGLSGISACGGVGDEPDPPDAAVSCEPFASATPSARISRNPDGFTLYADAPASIQADSARYVVTDGSTESSGEASAEGDIRVDVVAAIEGPWTATITYRRAGCADRTVVHDLDLTPPPPVSGPTGSGGVYAVTLDWTPPSDADFVEVSISMKVGGPPTGPDDPDAIGLCNVLGAGMVRDCGTPPVEWRGIPAGEVHFAVYAVDAVGNASEGVTTTATIEGIDAWHQVAACEAGSFGIASDRTLWGWGDVVGRAGSTYSSVSPVQLGTDSEWAQVDCGLLRAIALMADGRLFAWGAAGSGLEPTRIGDASDWTAISSGRDHFLALRSPGTLWAWGANQRGQLGDGTMMLRSEPVQVGTDDDWAAIAAGTAHSLAIKQDGRLWGFGGTYGSTPVRIGAGTDWTSVAAGYSASFGIRGAGTLSKWGTSEVSEPEPVGAETDWTAVSASADALARRADGSLWIIPYGGSEATPVGAGMAWEAASAGMMFSHAVAADGARYAWGENSRGQLGDGTYVTRTEPTRVP